MYPALRKLLWIISLAVATATSAGTVIVQIGGGDHIDNSQGQIEDNVIWLNRILRKTEMPLHNFFGSGKLSEKDVSLYVQKDFDSPMMVLSRVFDEPDVERIQYRHNRVPELSGSMYKDEIMKSLEGIIKGLPKQQDFLLIFNGHGQLDKSDIRKNSLKTWGRGEITVGEMDDLFDMAPGGTTLRFVFPQCYSGGFYHLIYENPYSSKFSNQYRCGFMAESPYDQSEGCSLSTNREEYRDYSTYFFAPLNGKTRIGGELVVEPDLDRNGEISYSESHIYAIKAGRSKDLSRSTSEAFLEDWMPWYLRWGREQMGAQSKYWDIAEFLADRDGYELDDKELNRARTSLKEQMVKWQQRAKDCYQDANAIAKRLKKEAVKHWPELLHPYTSDYKATIENQSERIADLIKSNSDYGLLVETQDSCAAKEKVILKIERDVAQVEKILRYLKLATIEYYFNRFASDAEKAHYESLLKCEQGAFFQLPSADR